VTILTDSTIGLFAVGVPARMADPLGVWSGEAQVTGDAGGGTLGHRFTVPSGGEQRFVFVIDHVMTSKDSATAGGDILIRVQHHHELANQTLDNSRLTVGPTRVVATHVFQASDVDRWLKTYPVWWRRDFGGTVAERELVRITWGTNVDGDVHEIRASGRFYDARILASRDFWTLFPSTQPVP